MSDVRVMDDYQTFIYLSRYSRYKWDEGRRELWPETVARYFDFFENHLKEKHNFDLKPHREILERALFTLNVMPSMRCLATAGEALARDNVAAYNCSYLPIDRTTSFDEVMQISLNGCGVGFSVERQYINKLPEVADEFHQSDTTITVADSKIGWSKALKELIHLLYGGQIPKWDLSKLRPAGAPLKTFGGRASGPAPLEDLFKFTVNLFRNAAGRKLTSLECHDLVCKIGDAVISGGVRRTALISLSNLSDERLRGAKTGKWWEINPHRALSNNSAVYTEKPEIGIFMKEWLSIYDSKSGERGVFNRKAMKDQVEKTERRDQNFDFGVNPCGEIILRPNEFCNLSEVVVRESDTLETLKKKVEVASIFGTIQSTLTDFKYINKNWKRNTEEERLLGVSLTGVLDNTLTNGKRGKNQLEVALKELKQVAIDTNKEWSKKLGIPQSMAVTTQKPSGNVSQLVGSASGIHPRHSHYYIRTVRADKNDPLAAFMIMEGFPYEADAMKPEYGYVFSFPIRSPERAITRNDLTAIEHMELWKIYRNNWSEHNISCTITVKENEWLKVGAWIFENFDDVGGLSFLPHSDHIYQQAPYQEISKEEYDQWLTKMPKNVDWSKLKEYEKNMDMTNASSELACSAMGCEIL